MNQDVPDILKAIIKRKHEEIRERSSVHSQQDLEHRAVDRAPARGFKRNISETLNRGKAAVIAEIKKASPSKGIIRPDFNPVAIAESYERAGATCLSVLTDVDYFQGSTQALLSARQACALPVIRKDFIVHPYQVVESGAMEADCVLLIAAALDDSMMRELNDQALALGMDVLVEVHDAVELQRALSLDPQLLGINNRDLRSFTVSLDTTESLLKELPVEAGTDQPIVITESGILERSDVLRMRRANVHTFLVGETFMRADHPGEALRALFDV